MPALNFIIKGLTDVAQFPKGCPPLTLGSMINVRYGQWEAKESWGGITDLEHCHEQVTSGSIRASKKMYGTKV